MPTFGVTGSGFVPKQLSDIISDFEAAEVTLLDPAINAGAATPLGQLNGIYAAALAELWEVAQVAYNGLNRDDAEGPALDNIGDIDGDTRLAPTPSSVTCECTLTAANSPYAAGTLVCNVNGNSSIQFSNVLTVTVATDGTYPVLMASLLDGPQEATANTLTVITSPVTGWTAVYNPSDATPGAYLETDPDYRERQREELAATGACTVDAITANLLQVPGLVAVFCRENTADFTDPVTLLPGHSFEAIVWDGTLTGTIVAANTIAQAIWEEKPTGVQTYGQTFGTAIDAAGNAQTVRYTYATELPVYLAYTVTLGPGVVLSTIAPIIKQTVVYLSNGLQADGVTPLDPGVPGQLLPGVGVTALVYRAAALNVSGVVDVPALALAFTPAPTATSNLPVPAEEIANLQTANITVNGI
jgi:hypothetical protein